ncbi:MAG: helix-turn-helix transcriptional regulator [Nitrospirae bacterium]|nr:helix-turn-helix transcriptional regulator [Magnetococcales bacterium]HAT48832.1 transcriptional regulator [Alphaproteobacteria bacterium]
MEENTFAVRLRFARQRMGLTQSKLGTLIGLAESVSSPRINRYERDSRQPSIATVARLSKVLEVSPSYFYEPDDLIAEVILHLSNMSRNEIEIVLSRLVLSHPLGQKNQY